MDKENTSEANRYRAFKFLDSYGKDDQDVFFGRERETDAIYTALTRSKTVVVYGKSGTGKSSIIGCGLRGRFSDSDWQPVFVRRKKNLSNDFAAAIQDAALTPVTDTSPVSKALRNLYLDYFKPITLVFDQFEELFIFGSDEEVGLFFDQVRDVLKSELNVRFVFVIREDFLASMSAGEATIPELLDNRVRIEHMNYAQVREVVRKMVSSSGLSAEEEFLDELLGQIGTQNKVELSFLQVYMDYLVRSNPDSKTLTGAMVEATGSFQEILKSFLLEQIKAQSSPAKAEALLKSFVTSFGTKRLQTLDEATRSTLEFGVELSESEALDLLNGLTTSRVLRRLEEGGRYELRHDQLAAVVYERITLAERELMEAKQFAISGYRRYKRKGTSLSKEDVDYLQPYLHRLYLDKEVGQFVDRAVRLRERARSRALIWSRAGIAMLVVVVGVLLWQMWDYRQAEQARLRIEESHRLAALATSEDMTDPVVAFLLAERAHKLHPDAHSQRALMEVYDKSLGHMEKLECSFYEQVDSNLIAGVDYDSKRIELYTERLDSSVASIPFDSLDVLHYDITTNGFWTGTNFIGWDGDTLFNGNELMREKELLQLSHLDASEFGIGNFIKNKNKLVWLKADGSREVFTLEPRNTFAEELDLAGIYNHGSLIRLHKYQTGSLWVELDTTQRELKYLDEGGDYLLEHGLPADLNAEVDFRKNHISVSIEGGEEYIKIPLSDIPPPIVVNEIRNISVKITKAILRLYIYDVNGSMFQCFVHRKSGEVLCALALKDLNFFKPYDTGVMVLYSKSRKTLSIYKPKERVIDIENIMDIRALEDQRFFVVKNIEPTSIPGIHKATAAIQIININGEVESSYHLIGSNPDKIDILDFQQGVCWIAVELNKAITIMAIDLNSDQEYAAFAVLKERSKEVIGGSSIFGLVQLNDSTIILNHSRGAGLISTRGLCQMKNRIVESGLANNISGNNFFALKDSSISVKRVHTGVLEKLFSSEQKVFSNDNDPLVYASGKLLKLGRRVFRISEGRVDSRNILNIPTGEYITSYGDAVLYGISYGERINGELNDCALIRVFENEEIDSLFHYKQGEHGFLPNSSWMKKVGEELIVSCRVKRDSFLTQCFHMPTGKLLRERYSKKRVYAVSGNQFFEEGSYTSIDHKDSVVSSRGRMLTIQGTKAFSPLGWGKWRNAPHHDSLMLVSESVKTQLIPRGNRAFSQRIERRFEGSVVALNNVGRATSNYQYPSFEEERLDEAVLVAVAPGYASLMFKDAEELIIVNQNGERYYDFPDRTTFQRFFQGGYVLTAHRLGLAYELFPGNAETVIESVRENGWLGAIRDFTGEEIQRFNLLEFDEFPL